MKFKNTKKKKGSEKSKKTEVKQLPRNYRIIPESWDKDELAFFIGALFILASILIVSFDLFSNLSQEKKLTDTKVKLIKEQNFWQNVVRQRPNYRDAYYNLALIDLELRDNNSANKSLQKALALDPNFEEGISLEKKINGKE